MKDVKKDIHDAKSGKNGLIGGFFGKKSFPKKVFDKKIPQNFFRIISK